jgi:hypothetical protein
MPKEDTQFKPGQSGNPAGRPAMPEDLKAAKALTKQVLMRELNDLIHMTKSELEAALVSPESTMIRRMAARVIQEADNNGDDRRLGFLLDRLVGKVKDELALELPRPTIIRYKGEKVILTTDKQEEPKDGDDGQ